MDIINHLKRLDWIIIFSVFALVGIGLLFIYHSSLNENNLLNFQKQIIFLGIGTALMLFISFFDWRILRENPYLIIILYLVCLTALAGLFIFAPQIRGTKAWYKLGLVSVEPVEFMKVILIILLAKYFSMRHVEMYRIQHILYSGFYLFLPVFLIFLQPDLGSALILICLWVGVLLVSGIKLRHFLVLSIIGLAIFTVSWLTILKDYQKERLLNFVQPQISDYLKIGWSQQQAKIAVGSGGIFGQGIGKGSQTQYGFLTEPQTDFIFSSIAEETGLMGSLVLFSIFGILIWRITKIAYSATSNFPRLFASGFIIVLISQIFINIGMNIGILPIIGIVLPFVSYGGSSLLAFFITLGILQNIKTDL
ncbi:MAG: FtsW/RodA/SpoVE family cell cycle protein [bacterium]